MMTEGFLELDSGYVLATRNGAPLVTEKDILTVMSEEVGVPRDNRTRMRLVTSLSECASFGDAARALKLDNTWEYKAFVRLARVNYIVTNYTEMLENEFPISEDSLKAYFEKNGNPVRPKLSFEESKQDISDYILFPQNILKQAFYFNYEMNNGKSIDDIRRKVFSENIREFRRNRMDRKRAEAWTAANVHVYRQSLNIKGPKMVLSAMEQVADSLAKEHNYNGAIDQWKEIRFVYPALC